MSILRPMGTETEFGIIDPKSRYANLIALSSALVKAYRQNSRAGAAVSWDYSGEDPLHDLRGFHIDRAAADPSQLTDDPNQLAGFGPGTQVVLRPGTLEARLPKPTATVLANGARWYVDHAHPEYSAPETMDPIQGAIYDLAGDTIARRAAQLANDSGISVALYKNNQDGKGASYGCHENYLVSRQVEFTSLAQYLIPFLVTRPIFCGSGRVGLGPRGNQAGFQISQRADYIENDIGLETTFNRPIVNTRDEPHATRGKWRRLHVINGDANLFSYSTYLRLGATSALLWLIEQGEDHPQLRKLRDLQLVDDPVELCYQVSRDLDFKTQLATVGCGKLSALQIQRYYCEAITQAMKHQASKTGELDQITGDFLANWHQVLQELQTDRAAAARKVEWLAKYQLLERMRQRSSIGWDHPTLKALDLKWAALEEGSSLVEQLKKAGMVQEICTRSQVLSAISYPPEETRAFLRGRAVSSFPQVSAACWESLTLDLGEENLIRLSLGDPQDPATAEQKAALTSGDAAAFVQATKRRFQNQVQ